MYDRFFVPSKVLVNYMAVTQGVARDADKGSVDNDGVKRDHEPWFVMIKADEPSIEEARRTGMQPDELRAFFEDISESTASDKPTPSKTLHALFARWSEDPNEKV